MTCECHYSECPKHCIHFGDEGPFCDEPECVGVQAMAERIRELEHELAFRLKERDEFYSELRETRRLLRIIESAAERTVS